MSAVSASNEPAWQNTSTGPHAAEAHVGPSAALLDAEARRAALKAEILVAQSQQPVDFDAVWRAVDRLDVVQAELHSLDAHSLGVCCDLCVDGPKGCRSVCMRLVCAHCWTV